MAHYQQVNHFHIDLTARKLGQGSQGTVYPGINLTTEDPVAAKRTEGVYKEYFNKREFEKEAELLLHKIPPHENIIKVHDFTKTEYVNKGIPMLDLWLITELCELGNLKEFAFSTDLGIEQKVELMYQSALAVRHLHGCKPESISHRDIKPENILVTGSEEYPIIKLCDFGSAKSVTREGAKSVAMRSQAGTKRYQAPEQFEFHDGKWKYDKQVDIFSLGVTFLALLNAVKGSLMSPETINEKGLGETMWIKHKQNLGFTFCVHKPSDSALVGAVKTVIEKMIKYEASSRLSADQVVEELSKLKAGYSKQQPTEATSTRPAPATDTQSEPAPVDTCTEPTANIQPAPSTDTRTDTQSEPTANIQPASSADTQSEPSTDTQSEPTADIQSAPSTDTQSEPTANIQSATSTDTQSEPTANIQPAPSTDTQSEPTADIQPAPSTDTQSEPTADIQSASVTDTQSEPTADIQPAPATDTQSAPASDIQPAPVTDTQSSPATVIQPAPATDTQSEPTADIQPAPVTDTQSEPTADIQSPPSIDTQSEPTTDIQPAPATDTQSAPASNIQSALVTDTQSEPTANMQSAPFTDTQSEPTANIQSAPFTDTQSEPTADIQSASVTDTPSEPTADIQPAPTADTQSAPASDTHPEPATDTQSAPATVIQSAPATDSQSAPATDTQSAPATDNQSAPATDNQSAPATDNELAPATDTQSTPAKYTQSASATGTQSAPAIDTQSAPVIDITSAPDTDTTSALATHTLPVPAMNPQSASKSFLPKGRGEVELRPMPWYHGKMTSYQAHTLLAGKKFPESVTSTEAQRILSDRNVGTFLVHEADNEEKFVIEHIYTLLVVGPDRRVVYYRIVFTEGYKLTINDRFVFGDLLQLVQAYQEDAYGLCTRLQTPLVHQGDLSVCVNPGTFSQKGWTVSKSEIHIFDRCYTGEITDTHNGEYFGRRIFIRKRKDKYSVQESLIEAAIMSGLSHKNVVQLIGVVLGEETLIVTEYLARGRLFEYLRSHGPDTLSSHDQLNIAKHICQGMQYLEDKEIIHRRLTTRSILLSEKGTAKIVDFSSASKGCKEMILQQFKRFPIRSTPPDKTHTSKSDMWSFGVLLWEIYTFGRQAYAGILDKDVYSHVVDGGRLEAPQRCPDEIYHVMCDAWDIDPTMRPSFSDVCKILDRLYNTLPGSRVVALCDYTAPCTDYLSFKKYDAFTITTETQNRNVVKTKGKSGSIKMVFKRLWRKSESPEQPTEWHYAEDKSGTVGRIPVEHVRRRRDVQIRTMPWYHGELTREQAHTLLKEEDAGTFLVQNVDNEAAKVTDHEYTLRMVSPDKDVKHYRILKQDGKLTIDKKISFQELDQLVLFYQKNAGCLCTLLQKPLVRQGNSSKCVDSRDFLQEGWNISRPEIQTLDKCYTGEIIDTSKGEYVGRQVFIRQRKDKYSVQNSHIEAAIMSGLSHKNVVQLIGVVLGEETLIVTEYLARGRLFEYLRAHGPDTLSSHDQLNIAKDICQGMQYLEEKQIFHRNLLSRSVLLSEDGTAKVGDFALACPADQDEASGKIPRKWTALEVLQGESYTSKCDIWSFGVVLWEIFSFGSTPYPGTLNTDVDIFVTQGRRLEAPDRCPTEIYHVMSSAWDVNPAKRPTFLDVYQTLSRLCVDMK